MSKKTILLAVLSMACVGGAKVASNCVYDYRVFGSCGTEQPCNPQTGVEVVCDNTDQGCTDGVMWQSCTTFEVQGKCWLVKHSPTCGDPGVFQGYTETNTCLNASASGSCP